jgi:hypothetical protein
MMICANTNHPDGLRCPILPFTHFALPFRHAFKGRRGRGELQVHREEPDFRTRSERVEIRIGAERFDVKVRYRLDADAISTDNQPGMRVMDDDRFGDAARVQVILDEAG